MGKTQIGRLPRQVRSKTGGKLAVKQHQPTGLNASQWAPTIRPTPTAKASPPQMPTPIRPKQVTQQALYMPTAIGLTQRKKAFLNKAVDNFFARIGSNIEASDMAASIALYDEHHGPTSS